MSLKNIEIARSQVGHGTPKSIIEAIAAQIDRQEEAKKRIDEEGIVVRDTKGSVIPHPAIKIEQESAKTLMSLISQCLKNF